MLAPWAEDGFDYEATLEEFDEATQIWVPLCYIVSLYAVTVMTLQVDFQMYIWGVPES